MAESKSSRSKFTPEERAAMKQRAKEPKEQQSAAEALQAVLDKIASLDEPGKTNAERIHAIVRGERLRVSGWDGARTVARLWLLAAP